MIPRPVYIISFLFDPPISHRFCGIQERNMLTLLKWILTIFFTALAWLITGYTMEYFKPYRKK
jgi:hypothetical protein